MALFSLCLSLSPLLARDLAGATRPCLSVKKIRLPPSLCLSLTHHPKTATSKTNKSSFQGPGKKWESTPLTANGKPVFQSVHVKTGDTVQVITGSDKGKVGVVSKVLLKTGQVVVEGVNVKVRRGREVESFGVYSSCLFPFFFTPFGLSPPPNNHHHHHLFSLSLNKNQKQTKTVQPKSKDETGRLVQTESPIHSSNVMAYSKEKEVRSRIGHKTGADGKKVRVLLKTGEELP